MKTKNQKLSAIYCFVELIWATPTFRFLVYDTYNSINELTSLTVIMIYGFW
jgi:hypothetical protein